MHYVIYYLVANAEVLSVDNLMLIQANNMCTYVLTKFALSLKATADKNHNQFTKINILLVLAYAVNYVTDIVCLHFRNFKPRSM